MTNQSANEAIDTSGRRRTSSINPGIRWVANRWPAALAIALSAPGLLNPGNGSDLDDLASSLGNVLFVLPLGYLTLAKLRRRWATWPVVVAGIGIVVIARALDLVPAAVVLSALALVILVWSVVDGQFRRDGELRLQAIALVAFAGLACSGLAVLSSLPVLGTWLIAAGWFLHGVWDFIHLKRDKVVSRSFAEWCGVIDVLLAAELLLLLA